MTKKQVGEIKCLDYFRRKNIDYSKSVYNIAEIMGVNCTEDKEGLLAEEAYFEITDNGKKDVVVNDKARLNELLDSQKWRLRTMDMWEQGVLDGTIPYIELIEESNKEVVNFMASTMFQGTDKDIIINLYKEIYE